MWLEGLYGENHNLIGLIGKLLPNQSLEEDWAFIKLDRLILRYLVKILGLCCMSLANKLWVQLLFEKSCMGILYCTNLMLHEGIYDGMALILKSS